MKTIGKKIKIILLTIVIIITVIIGIAACERITNIKLISQNVKETEYKGQTVWNNENGKLGLEITEDQITTSTITAKLKNVQIDYESEQDLEYKYYIKKSNEIDYKNEVNSTGKEYTYTDLKSETNYDIKVKVVNSKTQNKVEEELKKVNTKEIPNAKQELEKGTIVVESPTWSNNVATLQVSTTTQYKIEYQVNTATEGGWVQGSQTGKTTISNLKNGDIVKIRLTDGINKGKVGSVKIGQQPEASINKQSTTANSITVQVVCNNKEYIKETGTEYSYYIKKASETTYPTTPTYIGTSTYTFNNLLQGTNYDIKVELINKAGNKVQAIGNIVTEASIPKLASGYGWYRSSYDKTKITTITLKDSYTPTGSVTETWDASNALNKSIMAYRTGNSIIIAGNGSGYIKANEYSSQMFTNFKALTSINGLDILDTSNVTDMSSMFHDCESLNTLNISNFDTSNVRNMQCMFMLCTELTSLDLSGFDTKNVTNMKQMFMQCTKITNLNVSKFDTRNVTDMSYMFLACGAIKYLDVSGFDTSNVTYMNTMFASCSSLTSLDVSNFDTSKVIDMNCMFGCPSLTSLDVSGFDTRNVTNMRQMFSDCNSLKSLDVSGFDTSKVTYMDAMFQDCNSLTYLDLRNFNTGNVTNMRYMFLRCVNLTSIDLGNYDTRKVTDMYGMFDNCSNLKTIYTKNNFSTASLLNSTNMFIYCYNLKGAVSYNSSKTDASMANYTTGYFTYKP